MLVVHPDGCPCFHCRVALVASERASRRKSGNPFEPDVKRRAPLPADGDGVKAAGAAVHRLRG